MKIAVVGSGISGLASAYLLSIKHEVHLFEAGPRLGGHAHTSDIKTVSGSTPMDTGFLVYNELTYPHLTALFKHLNVETAASDMSLSIQLPHENLEWSGDNLSTVFAQKRNLLRPKFYRLIFDILDFHKKAEHYRQLSRTNRWTVRELLQHAGYSKQLSEWYILPMIAAIWSTPEVGMLSFPAETFLTFFINHKLLQVNDRPIWRTVKNGSRNYVEKLAKGITHVHLNEGVISAERLTDGVRVSTIKSNFVFDKVVFATHAPVTAKILKAQSALETSVLGSFLTEANRAVLHQDINFMPKRKKCWASWNVQGNFNTNKSDKVSLTYYLNRLQPIEQTDPFLLTLNPTSHIEKPLFQEQYSHPIFDRRAIDNQSLIPELQGIGGVYYAGAWTRYGFHEDGLLSAVKVARYFDIDPPWPNNLATQ